MNLPIIPSNLGPVLELTVGEECDGNVYGPNILGHIAIISGNSDGNSTDSRDRIVSQATGRLWDQRTELSLRFQWE